jgi:hypothetical protein
MNSDRNVLIICEGKRNEGRPGWDEALLTFVAPWADVLPSGNIDKCIEVLLNIRDVRDAGAGKNKSFDEYQTILIVVDADKEIGRRKQQIQSVLNEVNTYHAGHELPLLIQNGDSESAILFDSFLFPDNQSSGIVETLLFKVCGGSDDKCLEALSTCVEAVSGASYNASHEKGLFNYFYAVNKKENKTPQKFIENHVRDDSSELHAFRVFLNKHKPISLRA